MQIATRTKDFPMSKSIDRCARGECYGALHRFSRDIVAVDVFMKDCNGPRGGVDKLALIRIRLRNRQILAIETVHENLYAAICKGARRARRTVRRHLRKARRIARQRVLERLHVSDLPATG